jgi:hypothetical protein
MISLDFLEPVLLNVIDHLCDPIAFEAQRRLDRFGKLTVIEDRKYKGVGKASQTEMVT